MSCPHSYFAVIIHRCDTVPYSTPVTICRVADTLPMQPLRNTKTCQDFLRVAFLSGPGSILVWVRSTWGCTPPPPCSVQTVRNGHAEPVKFPLIAESRHFRTLPRRAGFPFLFRPSFCDHPHLWGVVCGTSHRCGAVISPHWGEIRHPSRTVGLIGSPCIHRGFVGVSPFAPR